MTIANGVSKRLAYKAESTFGVAAGAASAQVLRRTESSLDLTKDTYQSNEIRDDAQIADFRHGVRRVAGSIKGELSPKTYADFLAALLRRDFAAVTAISALSITVAGAGPTYTATRAAGSWLTDGVKIGNVVRFTAGSFNALNLNKNLLVTAVTATIITCVVLNGSALFAEGPIASATLTLPGKKTYVPVTGHTDKSFSIEHWFADIAQSELFLGCKIGSAAINLPPTGMATADFTVIGKDVTNTTAAYFTTPTAATSTGIVAAVNGVLLVGGVAVAVCTGLSINIEGNYSGDPVVGSNSVPDIKGGRVVVSGQFTAYFENATLRDNFINEDEIAIAIALTTSNAAAADFVAFSMPRLKVGGAAKSDGEKGLIATFPYQALLNSAGGTGTSTEQSTLAVQDSQA